MALAAPTPGVSCPHNEGGAMNPVYCKQCGATLRATAGLHRAGEPYIEHDASGPYIKCPKCGSVNRDLTPARLAERPENRAGASR
jgi:DNA-directed RNA polymerase subunit RPC12/RpoP